MTDASWKLAKFSYVTKEQTYFFLILQFHNLKTWCNSLKEVIGIIDLQFQFLGEGCELCNRDGERNKGKKG